jgi:PEP-CTERM motif
MKFFKIAGVVLSGFLAFGAVSEPAGAATVTFAWTLTGPAPGLGGVPFPGSGTITATVSAVGGDPVTAITGTVNGSMITALNTFNGADNLLFPTGTTFLSTHGISFATAAGQDINIFSFFPQGTPPSGNAYGELSANPSAFGVGTFAISAVPEPSTWAMMLIGFAGLGFAFRQSRRMVSFA